MSDAIVYWRGWTENQLASYQQNQGSNNHCAKYAAVAALNMLYGTSLSGETLVSWVNDRLFKGTLRYTIFGNNHGSFVFQTANLLRRLAHLNGLTPLLRSKKGNFQSLKNSLQSGNSLTIVSVTYFQGQEPVIAYGRNSGTALAAANWVGGHLMILAAFDPGHKNLEDTTTPWGFLSSWPGKDHLYWMTDDNFKQSWGKLSLYNLVTITRMD